MDENLKNLAHDLNQKGMTIAVAESCTGGMLGAKLTELPGSSRFFVGGITAYENRAKRELLGVKGDILLEKGAVSAETARSMARGARERFQADLGISITGIAGPGGGTAAKPVGLVWIGVSWTGGEKEKKLRLAGSREEIREKAVTEALNLAREKLPEAVPRSIRTFVAVALPPNLAGNIYHNSAPLRAAAPQGRWVDPTSYHFTLAFLGDTCPTQLAEIRQQLNKVAKNTKPFSVQLEDTGTFPPNSPPRVVWLGVGKGSKQLNQLSQKTWESLSPLGFKPRDRNYLSHLTLGRFKGGLFGRNNHRLASALITVAGECTGDFKVEVLLLIRSRLTPSGPIYRVISEPRLGGT